MLFKLICLNNNGVSVAKAELGDADVHSGNLVVDYWIDGSAFNRPTLRARLLTTGHSMPTDVIAPLFEVKLGKMTNHQLTINGIEIVVHGSRPVHYSQSWLIRFG